MRTIQTAEEVVETALNALPRHKSLVVSGWTNWMMVQAERFVPRSWVIKVAGKALRSKVDE
jgi:short-subunit dehydrogenase